MELDLVPDWEIMETPLKSAALVSALGMYDWSLAAKKMLAREFFISSVSGAGTRQHSHIVKSAVKGEIGAAFCLTEISHGTNTRALRTTATYNPDNQTFILHTPDFEAAKCWAGNLAKTATHASVFAQLITPDGVCQGLHNFVVPVRDPATLLPLPGITIGDMGHKIGLNGLDNGWLMFNNYQIAREMLLNKTGDVSKEGVYSTPFKDPNKRFGASLGNLSGGRVGIINMANTNLHLAVVIAVRYSAVRSQFGPPGQPEQPVLNYQLQQRRLIPYLAASFAHHHFSMTFYQDYMRLLLGKMSGEDPDVLASLGHEIHGVSCAGKPLASWVAQQAVQECREGCGGHGYLRVSRLGRLRDDNDANCTYEGDNNVLLQQTSNWLLSLYRAGKADSPLGTIAWLSQYQDTPGPLQGDITDPHTAVRCLRALVFRLLVQTTAQIHKLQQEGRDSFFSRNNTQYHLARTMAMVFIQSVIAERFRVFTKEHMAEFPVLSTLCSLYACWSVEQYGADLLLHNVITPDYLALTRTQVLTLCEELLPDAVSLTDCLSPTDFILNSALGHSSGNVYQLLHQSFLSVPGGFERPEFWVKYTERFREKSRL